MLKKRLSHVLNAKVRDILFVGHVKVMGNVKAFMYIIAQIDL